MEANTMLAYKKYVPIESWILEVCNPIDSNGTHSRKKRALPDHDRMSEV